nr:hypothetical protein [Coxiella burnetii]
MSEAKYGNDRRHHCFPVFRFAHTGYFTIFYLLFDRNMRNRLSCGLEIRSYFYNFLQSRCCLLNFARI